VPRNVNDIIKSLPAVRRLKIERRASKLIADELTLQELRRARVLTQARMAKKLGVAQKQISQIEKRTDMHISTLRRSIEAMGGKLSLIAEFPDRKPVVIAGIALLDEPRKKPKPTGGRMRRTSPDY
jgi:DNA-binding XRE family transcriptional regulator